MKPTKREFSLYQLYDYQGVEHHLEAMAAKGWRLERIGTYFWHYRRAEPAQVSYAVTYVSDGSLFNPRPTENQERLDELCAAAGWEKVCDWAQMQIFVSERPDPVPLETEDAVRIQAIHRSMKKNFLPSNYVLLALPLLWLFMAWNDFRRDMVDFFSSSTDLFLVLLSIFLLILQMVNLSAYYRWRRHSLTSVAQGGPDRRLPAVQSDILWRSGGHFGCLIDIPDDVAANLGRLLCTVSADLWADPLCGAPHTGGVEASRCPQGAEHGPDLGGGRGAGGGGGKPADLRRPALWLVLRRGRHLPLPGSGVAGKSAGHSPDGGGSDRHLL